MCIRIELLDIFHLNEIRNINLYMVNTSSNCLPYTHCRYFLWREILIYSLCLLCENRLTKRKAQATILYIPLINLSCHNSTTHIQGEKQEKKLQTKAVTFLLPIIGNTILSHSSFNRKLDAIHKSYVQDASYVSSINQHHHKYTCIVKTDYFCF